MSSSGMSCSSSCDTTPLTSPDFPTPFAYYSSHTSRAQSSTSTSTNDGQPAKREKRKYRCRVRSPATIERAKKQRRDKANARERRRMNHLNDALDILRTKLPQLPEEPKMTKIETLRVAQWYIRVLITLLEEGSDENVEQLETFKNFLNECEQMKDEEVRAMM